MMGEEGKVDRWVERFQCLRASADNVDPTVQVYFKRTIQGHPLEGLEEHRFNLSQLFWLKELLDADRVEELEKASGNIPAADRIVDRSDNSKAFDDALAALLTV
jgi:hypothetical protein